MNHQPTRSVVFLLATALLAATITRGAQGAILAAHPEAPAPSVLHAGVVAAIDANHTLSDSVLWTDRIPRSATRSTQGPALTGMAASAAQRRRQRLRVRMLHDRFRIASIRLLRQGTGAQAVVQSDQLLLPSALSGEPLGRPVSLDERAQIELHRVGATGRFVVWSVTLLP